MAVGEPAIDVYKSNVAFGGIYDELESNYQAQFKKPTNFYGGVFKNGVEIATLNDIPNHLDIYSTEEKIIGTWIDGKPIYRKVIECGNLANNTEKNVPCNIGANIVDQMVKQSLIWYDTVDKTWINDSRWDSTSIRIEYHYNDSNDVIWINSLGTNWSGRTTKACAILEYTKTTD